MALMPQGFYTTVEASIYAIIKNVKQDEIQGINYGIETQRAFKTNFRHSLINIGHKNVSGRSFLYFLHI